MPQLHIYCPPSGNHFAFFYIFLLLRKKRDQRSMALAARGEQGKRGHVAQSGQIAILFSSITAIVAPRARARRASHRIPAT